MLLSCLQCIFLNLVSDVGVEWIFYSFHLRTCEMSCMISPDNDQEFTD